MSGRIRVVSVIGRFLEHSRIIYFSNDGSDEYYIGSADWMPRNFIRRVEAVVPVDDAHLHERLRTLLETLLADNRQAWDLQSDGTWVRRMPDGETRATHVALLIDSWGRRPAVDRPASRESSPYAERGE